MKAVFADTVYYLALVNPQDQHYAAAVEQSKLLREPVVTTGWVLTEVADALCSARTRAAAVRLLELIRGDRNTTVVPMEAALFDRGLDLYGTRPDKDWSLTDCVSSTVMKDLGLTDALTTDHHFRQAGFRALLGQGG